jgi:hypothetical protein
MSKYVDVVITRQTQAVTQKGFGLPLILSTDKELSYTEYAGDTALADIGEEFGTNSNTYKLASAILSQTPRVEKVAVYGIGTYQEGDPATELSAALNTLILTHNDWYYLTCTEQADTEITELSNWAEANNKFYFASTSNQTLASTLNKERTVLLVHNDPTKYPAEAWVGACAAREIGSYTWTFKTLNGIEPANYDASTVQAIEDANASTYIREGGVNITSKGVTTSGDYIDIIQGQDYIQARMTENVFGLLVRISKVPFTYAGLGMVIAEVEKTLKDAANKGIIATDADGNPLYTVTAPKLEDISTNDKANRILPDIKWEATIAGAVENVKINGVLKL